MAACIPVIVVVPAIEITNLPSTTEAIVVLLIMNLHAPDDVEVGGFTTNSEVENVVTIGGIAPRIGSAGPIVTVNVLVVAT